MRTSFLTGGGLLTALSCIFIYISTIIPVNKLFILIICSSIITIGITTYNVKTGILIYISSSILSILILGFKGTVFLYLCFFGVYGIVKLYIEKTKNLLLELILKFSFFNIILLFSIYIYNIFFLKINIFNIKFNNINVPLPLVLLGLNLIFIIYDYSLTVFIYQFNKKFFQKKC